MFADTLLILFISIATALLGEGMYNKLFMVKILHDGADIILYGGNENSYQFKLFLFSPGEWGLIIAHAVSVMEGVAT